MNNTYQPINNEFLFDLKPIGVGYKCEFCNEGEMKYDLEKDKKRRASLVRRSSHLYYHQCDKCDSHMDLPKIYPYVEWVKV